MLNKAIRQDNLTTLPFQPYPSVNTMYIPPVANPPMCRGTSSECNVVPLWERVIQAHDASALRCQTHQQRNQNEVSPWILFDCLLGFTELPWSRRLYWLLPGSVSSLQLNAPILFLYWQPFLLYNLVIVYLFLTWTVCEAVYRVVNLGGIFYLSWIETPSESFICFWPLDVAPVFLLFSFS